MRNTPNRGFVDLPPLASYTRPRLRKQRVEARMRVMLVRGHARNIGETSVAALIRAENPVFPRGRRTHYLRSSPASCGENFTSPKVAELPTRWRRRGAPMSALSKQEI